MNVTTLDKLVQDRRRLDLEKNLARIKTKYLVMSGKGGVGKTTLAVALARDKAARGGRVGLLDIDLHGPSVSAALNLHQRLESGEDGKLKPATLEDGLKVVSIQGLLSRADQAVIWRGPKKRQVIEQFLAEVTWGDLDYLFIDSPPGTGDEPLTLLQLIPDVRPLMVTTGHKLSLSDVARAFRFLEALKVPPFGLIDNQSFLLCPHCGQRVDLYDRQGAAALARTCGVELLAELPWTREAAGDGLAEGAPVSAEDSFRRLICGVSDKL